MDLNSLQTVAINLPALDSSAKDAERRRFLKDFMLKSLNYRQKALRDLNERLSKTKKVETIAWDEDENNEGDVAKKEHEVCF